MNASVSVIVPVHNVERYVRRCLTALFALRVPDGVTVELVVVDDAGTDGSTAVVEELLPAAPYATRVLRHDTNRGLSAARNTGLAHATGEWVWFVDSDDYVTPDLLEGLLHATGPRVDIVVADMVPVSPEGVTDRPLLGRTGTAVWTGPQAVTEFLFQRIRAFMMNKLIRRALFDGLTFPVGRQYEDVAVMAWLLLRARTVAFAPGPLYFYLQRPGSITGRFDTRVLELHDAVDEALFVLDGAGTPSGHVHFRLRAGAMSVVDAAARSAPGALTAQAWEVIATVRRDLRLTDAARALRHRLPVVALGVLLIRLAPALYVRLYRAVRAVKRARERRLGRPWQVRAAAAGTVTPSTVERSGPASQRSLAVSA